MSDKIILTYEITGGNDIPIKKEFTLEAIENGVLMDHFENNRKIKFISLSIKE